MAKRISTSQHKSRNWKSIAIDVSAIIFSVLFALALDDWRQRRNTNARVDIVLQTLAMEIAANKKEVTRALAYHDPLVDSLSRGQHRMGSFPLRDMAGQINDEADVETILKDLFKTSREMMFRDIEVRQANTTNYYAKIGDRALRVKVETDSMHIYGDGNIQLRSARILNSAWETAMATQTTIHLDVELVAAMTELSRLHEVHDETVRRIINILYGQSGSVTSAMQDLRWFEQSLLNKYDALEAMLAELIELPEASESTE